MKLQLAARDIVVLLLVMYLSLGAAVYLIDIARDWCGSDPFDWYASVWYALFWPIRFLSSGSFCS